MKVGGKAAKLTKLDIYKLLNECLIELAEYIIQLNQEQMYERGILDIENPGLRQVYAPRTIVQKKKYAQYKKTQFVTLRWEGDFYESMKLEVFPPSSKFAFDIIASDEKWKNWLSKNPRFENALGLTKESTALLAGRIRPLLVNKIIKELK